MDKIKVHTSRKIAALSDLRAKLASLKETIASSQDQIRSDLALIGSENIRFFTYVTVVFLPLDFVTNLFSMSAPPNSTLLINMITVAVVAVLVTVSILLNAKAIGSVFEDIYSMFKQRSRTTMQNSFMIKHSKRDGKDREVRALPDPPGQTTAATTIAR
ncbi:Uu.00g021300.m01.CDS01 [Anthostomella pinea]|uniref:Uu.00g021300.m01.CDS01 n=1 Tax=Anthostomella pinea TaxID=933095 RepID=A0AAI8VZN0_9PEZI|nr:Uu.00g021300.m01.CDS01 [Anthostomella pinea]